jgi:hypothetical protein
MVCLPFFFFSCQGYPAALLCIIEKGERPGEIKKPKLMSPATMKYSDIWTWWVEGRMGRKESREEMDKNKCGNVFKIPENPAQLKGEKYSSSLIWMASNIWMVDMMYTEHLEE